MIIHHLLSSSFTNTSVHSCRLALLQRTNIAARGESNYDSSRRLAAHFLYDTRPEMLPENHESSQDKVGAKENRFASLFIEDTTRINDEWWEQGGGGGRNISSSYV